MIGLYLTGDLMFASRVIGAASAMGFGLEVRMAAEKLLEPTADPDVRLVLLDLAAPDCDPTTLVPKLKAAYPAARLVAYAPHVQFSRLSAAGDAGCHDVLTRGQFNEAYTAILQQWLKPNVG